MLYRSGLPGPALAAQFGINEGTVYAHLYLCKVERRPYRKLNGFQLERAIDLYRAGASVRVVVGEVGASKSAVHSALVAAGVQMRQG